jgi:outer membrane protein OmpA-like peptidoglycan-associated protein/tetratricopeptide (TPR) repeat protein
MSPGLKKSITVTLVFVFISLSSLFSQALTKKQFIKAVQDADISFYYDEDYERAALQYEYLFNIYPENSNLSAKLGICYLNIDGKKAEALKLLEKASSNIVEKDKDYIEYGEKAPLDTYLYRAIAYHKNDSLQKAILLFIDAKRRLSGTEIFSEEYIDNQIRDCRYAIEMKKKPLTIISNLFTPWLKDYPGASNPVLAKNDSVFVFTQKESGKTRILCSYKNKSWKPPVDITKQLGGHDRFYSNSITGDGKLLILYLDDGGDGNLYYSQRKDSVWSKIKSVGKPINTIYWQSHGFITPDGQEMYFSSNKPGGHGELDIWYSKKNPNGTWGEPENCGDAINTPYNEDTPFFDPETNSLLFSSLGHISMGGYDVFRSIKRNGIWTNPTGMPYAFNSTSENTFFILNNSAPGFITSIFNEKSYERNIYTVVAEDPADKITTARGTILLQDGLALDPNQTSIQLFDLKKGTRTGNIALRDSVSFYIDLKPGDYQIFVSHTGYNTDTINLNVPLYFPGNYIAVQASLIPDKVTSGDFLSINNILFGFDSYKLDEQAVNSLEILKTILNNYPDLKIEIAGYTDSKGSTEYNWRLADKRAQEVINYLIKDGISGSRFVKKAFGNSNFAAVNTNLDGSDNPEGRKYNRRATFGIVDSHTGVVISQETYTPRHLRLPSSMKYSIILIRTTKSLPSDHFKNLKIDETHFIKTLKIDSVTLYTLGLFYNRSDASKYLLYAKEKGFSESFIVSQYEINSESKSLIDPDAGIRQAYSGNIIYTIQLIATRKPIKMKEFKNIEGVREIFSEDGYYRYVTGEFTSFKKAKTALAPFIRSGYKDAFIRELNLLINK